MIKIVALMVTLVALTSATDYIDLTHGYDDGITVFPGNTQFKWIRHATTPDLVFKLNDFSTGEHCGTHTDAPNHLTNGTISVDKIPLKNMIVPAILIDACQETGNNCTYTLPAEKIIQWEKQNGEIPNGCVLIVKFGWTRFFKNPKLYIPGPGISKEAAEYIVKTKKILGVGLDTISLDQGSQTVAHKIILGAGLYNLENLKLDVDLPPKFNLIALPMKLINGTGGPTRVVACV